MSSKALVWFQLLCQTILMTGSVLSMESNATEFDFLRLHQVLLTNYSRHMRPLSNQSASITVSLKFDLLSVSDIDDVKQRISVLAVVSVHWKDKNLMWEPRHYGGLDRMYFSQQQIWAPTVYIVESQTKGPTLFNLPTNHLVAPDGTVIFSSSGILETSCSLDMTYFPYDYQSCKFGFGVLDSSKRDINLVSDPRGPQKASAFVPDGEWNIHGFSTAEHSYGSKNYEFQTLYVIMKLQRRSTYYVLNVIVPAVTVSMLSLITFAVPVESGERLAYALTNLLSLSVYITYIGSIIPSSSVDLPILLRYLVSLFLISSMCVVMTVVVIAMRWSRVVSSSDNYKSIFIFGLLLNIRRSDKRFGTLCRRKRIACVEYKLPIPADAPGLNSVELQNLWDTVNEKSLVDTPALLKTSSELLHGTKPVNKEVIKTSHHKKSPSCHEGMHTSNDDCMPKRGHEACPNYELLEADMDPDVLRLCSRVDLFSFLVLFAIFLIMTIVSFVQLNSQH
ncbi:acetylcholine receptor subunit alpha-L1-like [Biomphalaria glabrata]|uniref:Acetylcholine receptor subunit alpha-L1-like n=1 Tax=Biomphalaria glabrata TaxID=6526 RepID=A0A9U8DWM9_BIOGL|nr:acetylcholine receptor subunit alpha-L1-like [Biomphalaria glabrata]